MQREHEPSTRENNNSGVVPGKKGRWTEDEVDMLVEGVRLFGVGNWRQILDYFPFEGRTNVNLKDKYRNLLRHYSEEELLVGKK